jgi:putative nucleotidyltransferase with HDIG domain
MGAVRAKILVVDDEPQICSAICHRLVAHGFNCQTSSDPQCAKEVLATGQFDVLIADVAMPVVSGLDLLVHAKRNTPDCKVILITGKSNREFLAQALILGAFEYLEKPFNMDELVATVTRSVRNESKIPELPFRAADAIRSDSPAKRASLDSVWALIRAVEAKDPCTREHSEHVSHYAVALGTALGLTPIELESLRVAALLHDVGKIGTPDRILTKAGKLTAEEFEYIRRHPALGADILANITVFGREAELVRHHHERWDGTGYPDGLTGEEIPLASRIMCVADCMDAMLMERTYRECYPVEKMLGELERCAGTQFDPKIAAVAVQWCRRNPDKLMLPGRSDFAMPQGPQEGGRVFGHKQGDDTIRVREKGAPPGIGVRVAEILAICTVYTLLAKLGQLLATSPGHVTAIYPPVGFAVGVLLLRGRRVWPGIFLGQFLSNTWTFFDPSNLAVAAFTLLVGLAMSAGAVLQAIVGASLLAKDKGDRYPFDSVGRVLAFASSGCLACLISATSGVTSLTAGRIVAWSQWPYTWATWYLGDLNGFLLITPVMLALPHLRMGLFRSREQLSEIVLFLLVAVGTGILVFSPVTYFGACRLPLAFLALPLIAWAAMRLPQGALLAATLLLSSIAVLGTALGGGPFALASRNTGLLLLTLFVDLVMLCGLAMSAAIVRRNRIGEERAIHEEYLEATVMARTSDLKGATERLKMEVGNRRRVELGMEFLARAEAALRESEERFHSMIYSNVDGIVVVDREGIVRYTNPAAQSLFGRSAEKLLNQPFGLPVVAGKVTELDLMSAAGRPVIAEMRSAEIKWQGKMVHLVSLRDITDRKREEEAALQAKKAADEASRAKGEFLATMSHELRTPLNAIIGFSEGLLDRTDQHQLNDHQKDRIARILQSGQHLLNLINNILDLSKIEAGKTELDITTFDIRLLAKEVGFVAEALIIEKPDVIFSLDVERNLPPLTSDRFKVKQILLNLVSNAVKFTDRGHVALRIRCLNGRLEMTVQDTGIGIPKDQLSRIFEKFVQLNGSSRPSAEGTGLGLAIAKAYAELLEGTLVVRSTVGQGTTFVLCLPKALQPLAHVLVPILTVENLQGGSVALLAVNLSPAAARSLAAADEAALRGARNVLEQCIIRAKDVVLPKTTGDGSVATFHVLACTDYHGAEVLSRRIWQKLANCHALKGAGLDVGTRITMINLPPPTSDAVPEQLARDVATKIEDLLKAPAPTADLGSKTLPRPMHPIGVEK